MIRIGAALLSAVTFLGTVHAEELKPIQARSIELGNTTGVAYYTIGDDGFRVVATLASGEAGTPVRFVATLTSGQSIVLSVSQAVKEPARQVEIKRNGDSVTASIFSSEPEGSSSTSQSHL